MPGSIPPRNALNRLIESLQKMTSGGHASSSTPPVVTSQRFQTHRYKVPIFAWTRHFSEDYSRFGPVSLHLEPHALSVGHCLPKCQRLVVWELAVSSPDITSPGKTTKYWGDILFTWALNRWGFRLCKSQTKEDRSHAAHED